MRITPELLQQLRHAVHDVDPNGHLWLFGSRMFDEKRGGDIDLYLESSVPLSLQQSIALESHLNNLSGEKVDLIIRHPDQPMQIIHQIAKQGIPL